MRRASMASVYWPSSTSKSVPAGSGGGATGPRTGCSYTQSVTTRNRTTGGGYRVARGPRGAVRGRRGRALRGAEAGIRVGSLTTRRLSPTW
jgi:hypothetical protein